MSIIAIARMLVIALFLSAVVPHAFAYGEGQEYWISMLGDTDQQTRDTAAKKLLTLFQPSDKEEWKRKLSWIQPGMAVKDVEKRLKEMMGQTDLGMGSMCAADCSVSYILDDCYGLVVWYPKHGEEPKVDSYEIFEQVKRISLHTPADFTGVWTEYYVNGQKSHETQYKHGKTDGASTSFYSDGSKAVVQPYVEGITEGDETGYFHSGKVNYRGTYKAGKPVGIWTWYNEDGTVKSTRDESKPFEERYK